MSLDVETLQKELEAINAERDTTNERLRLFAQRGRGRGRGRGAFPGRSGAAQEDFEPPQGDRKVGDRPRGDRQGEGLSAGLWERLGTASTFNDKTGEEEGPRGRGGRFSGHDYRGGGFRERGDRGRFDRYEPPQEETAPELAEEPLPGSNKGRLASAIVVDAAQVDELGVARRPQENGVVNPAQKQRNKRLFGSLLGTLQKFQQEDQQFKRSKLAQSRAEAEQRAEERAAIEADKMREKQRQDIAKAKMAEMNKKRELDARMYSKRNEILVAQKVERELKLAGWLKTATQPALLWLPKLHSEDTDLLLQQRRADLDAWKAAQLAKLQNEKAMIESRFKPPEPVAPPNPTPTEETKAAEAVAIPMETSQPADAPTTAEEPDLQRYQAEEEDAEYADLPGDDMLATGEATGVQDLLR